MIGSTAALSIENARFSSEIREAYREVSSLNRAKDKVINRLSHEIKTPLSVLSASLSILEKRLAALPDHSWKATIDRAKRNLERILEIQYQVEDIMRERRFEAHGALSWLLDQVADELEVLVAEEVGEGRIVERLRDKIEELFGERETQPETFRLDLELEKIIAKIQPEMSHREVSLITHFNVTPAVFLPKDVLEKVVIGLLKNAVENTPDEGRVEVLVHKRGKGTELIVKDYGVGITEGNQRRIFEGFFMTQETIDYSSKRPFDFNAGGKGADLLRTKIFSERYNFEIHMASSRCRFIPKDSDLCPGRISQCKFCREKEDCFNSGGTTFSLYFPPADQKKNGEI